jgi:TPR repeat protein
MIQIRFIAPLKRSFKSRIDDRANRAGTIALGLGDAPNGASGQSRGRAIMARYELIDVDAAALGQSNAAGDMFFELGMMYATGRSVPTDLISAHKWFNLAAMRGNKEAIRLRLEIAAEMSEGDIAAAQRAARDWLRTH